MKDKVSPPAKVTVTQTCAVSSEMTGNDVLVSDFVEQEESSIMQESPKNEESSEWTNEKHSLYLKSIEASFVDQLYNSLSMQSCQTQKTCSSDAISTWKNYANTCSPSGQFKVLQDGCWSQKNFRRENTQLKDVDRPQFSPRNPWIQHFTNGSRHSLQEKPSSAATTLQHPVDTQLHQEPNCSNTEVTGQNFVEETSIEKTNSKKRMRASSNDQVVPFCTYRVTEIANSYNSPKK